MQSVTAALSQGEAAPSFSLQTPDGCTHSLDTFAGSRALAVVFLANHCPYVGSWEDRLTAIAREYEDRGVAFIAICSSDQVSFPQDGPEEMDRRAQEHGYPFPYLFDESQETARAFGATRTPEVFLFDGDRKLRYHGAIDSDWEEGPDVEPYLRRALDQLLSGHEISLQETRPLGCTIKLKQ